MTDDQNALPRRRAASAEAIAGRNAATLVRDLNRQLGAWQSSSVKLHAIAQRLSATGQSDPVVADEVRSLFHAVQGELARFETSLPDQSQAVAEHGRIKDTRQSFAMVSERLLSSLKLLGELPDPE